ncbi:hypothetical protein DEAC_c19610 [Desulfosporosinus acididurans]|uniref:Uncharacterized protein n=1 Tax=Desulfosporosinus acididurans TaxID=476652 RepID=A0A0J1FRI8_9FIRM|nr:hypothetical protein [Desulfosporosinus acididurans]KLU65922.1 hypothetical protein DEAC_c19610 [Desulfosporosinus acididurans]
MYFSGGRMHDNTFWTNTIWYILLGLSTIIELIFTVNKAKNRRKMTIAFYLTITGIALVFETMVLFFLKAYVYYPMILKNPPRPFDDVLAGNLFSQFSVGASALLVVVLNLKFYWFIIVGLIYGLIEELFLSLGIYRHNWYETWMTVMGIPLFFWVVKKMYVKAIQGIEPVFYYGYIFLALYTCNVITLVWGLLMLSRLQDFNTTLISDPEVSRLYGALGHFFLLSGSVMLIHFLRLKGIWKALVIILLYIIYYIGCKLNIVLVKEGRFVLVSTISICWTYLSVLIIDNFYNCAAKDKHVSRKVLK